MSKKLTPRQLIDNQRIIFRRTGETLVDGQWRARSAYEKQANVERWIQYCRKLREALA